MKKSEIYRLLQMTVIAEEVQFGFEERLEVLRELFIQEDLAKFAEEQEEAQKAVEG